MSKIGINGASNAPIKHENKTKEFKFKEWDIDEVNETLKNQIGLLIAGRNTYTTSGKLAASYLLTRDAFKEKCFEDEELTKNYRIYSEIYLEHIVTEALKIGKFNVQTETFLRDEMQAFTGSGFEQVIKWVDDKGELKHRDTGKEFNIVPDVDNKTAEKVEMLWETNNEDDKQ